MKILIVHQNFPGQFKHLVPELLKDPQHHVTAFTMNDYASTHPNLRVIRYQATKGTGKDIHPWAAETETKVIRGDAAFRAALALRAEGYTPDLILAHPGWGESLFLKDVWPDTKMVIYCEFHYASKGADIGFDPEFLSSDPGEACRLRMKNVNNFLHFEIADAGISPTEWQKSTFPEPFRSKIEVIHDGIDTDIVKPNAEIQLQVGSHRLTRADEVITFVNRNMEPYRGYHIFMRALPKILKARPNARVLIVGGDGVSYGAKPPAGQSWKQIFLNEVKDQIDLSRVHFLGHIDYKLFIPILQLSRVHVYLTYPFVLSWSLLEAMACGCAIVASDTAPLREAIIDHKTGLLADFFSADEVANKTIQLLENPELRDALGKNARAFAVQHYDLHQVCLPRMVKSLTTRDC
ncbi:glycosyltransferase family 4 protein [Zwartia sp.]|uniref:glycosyltransferase family 4 protein n=1 Tax=Zwartia sp. TaxID=2978004 RepID=UPI00271FB3EB|nr:glycosyltransferase family 4 protein [Zwartia sp.]MDO9025930.1 glycosyltransferase family 4 protein [Zwartia sp.]